MIEEIIKPREKSYSIAIPSDYIGKEVKLILYSLDEVGKQPNPKKKLSELGGLLSHETAEEIQKNVAQSRDDWEERLNKQF